MVRNTNRIMLVESVSEISISLCYLTDKCVWVSTSRRLSEHAAPKEMYVQLNSR